MSNDPLGPRLLAAAAIAHEAGHLARRYFQGREQLAVELKGHQDVVSLADRTVEELIRDRIGAAFPEDGLLGEEGGGDEAERLWVIDPIDGTANFLRGLPYWCVVLAYVEAGRTEIGVTYDPIHDELFVARRGQGAWRNGERIRVSGCSDPRRACVALSFNFKQDGDAYVQLMEGIVRHGMDHRRMGSTALKLCHVADGRVDALVTLHCSAWDVIAGLLTVKEAGGLATDYADGCRLTETRAVLACTPALQEVVEAISATRLQGLAAGSQ